MTTGFRHVALVALLPLQGCVDSTVPTAGQAEFAFEATRALLIEEDFDRWDHFFTDDAELNGSDLAFTIMRGTAQNLHHSFPDVQVRLMEQVSSVDKVVTRFVLEGTHTGSFSSLKPTNKRVTFDGICVDNFRDGRISRRFMLLDLYGLGQRLAAQPTSGS